MRYSLSRFSEYARPSRSLFFNIVLICCVIVSMALTHGIEKAFFLGLESELKILGLALWIPVGALAAILAWAGSAYDRRLGDRARLPYKAPRIIRGKPGPQNRRSPSTTTVVIVTAE